MTTMTMMTTAIAVAGAVIDLGLPDPNLLSH